LEVLYQAADAYRPQPYPNHVVLMRGTKKSFGFAGTPLLGWDGFLTQLTVTEVPGNHYSIMGPGAEQLSEEMNRHMQQAETAHWANRKPRL
ncbi:MAG TPA: hypothetical protein VFW94_19260, partial [Candidatus Acidoferrales bacterium]|nr:hypothetical protein [Candidatus Acidoferrales bacterium]